MLLPNERTRLRERLLHAAAVIRGTGETGETIPAIAVSTGGRIRAAGAPSGLANVAPAGGDGQPAG